MYQFIKNSFSNDSKPMKIMSSLLVKARLNILAATIAIVTHPTLR